MKKELKRIFSLAFCLLLTLTLLPACNENENGEETKYAVIFVLKEGSSTVSNPPAQQNVAEGKTAVRPTPDPGRTGHTFGGWYEDEEYGTEFDFSKPITQRTFVYALWTANVVYHTVTFNLNYSGAPDAETEEVRSGLSVAKPDDPERLGYRFAGWSENSGGTGFYNFSANVTGTLNLYAVWDKTYNVEFDFNHDGAPQSVTRVVLEGEPAQPPSVSGAGPEDWLFGGWYDEPECLTESDFSEVTGDMTVYAKWIDPSTLESKFEVSFDLNYSGAPAPETQEVFEGTAAVRPSDPERDVWRFHGWYTSPSGGNVYGFGAVSQDRTVYARWVAGYRLDYNYEGAPTFSEQIFTEGSLIPERPADPTRSADPDTGNAYTFEGWATASNGSPGFDGFGSPFTGSLVLYAQWKHTYVFEAEYTDLDEVQGSSISGAPSGREIVLQEKDWEGEYANAGASNGFYLAYLYNYGIRIFYEIESDRAATAVMRVRLTNEFEPMLLDDEGFLILVNGKKLSYDAFCPGVFDSSSDYWWNKDMLFMPFEDYLEFQIDLKEGINVIEFVINNNEPIGGTLNAAAPLFDCIKIDTIAALSWQPKLSNLGLILGEEWWL